MPVNISGIPLDPSALVYLVAPTNQTTNGGSEADQIPSGYTILATGTPDGCIIQLLYDRKIMLYSYHL